MSHSVRVFPSREALVQGLATTLIKDLDRLEHNQYYSVALQGNRRSRFLLSHLAEYYSDRISWENILLFWVEEIFLPPDREESHYRVVHDTLLLNVPLPDSNIFRIRGEADASAEARQYSELVGTTLPHVNGIPQFDMMLLVPEPDGSIASLSRGSRELFGSSRLYEAFSLPHEKIGRITATGRLISNSSRICCIAAGSEMAEMVATVLGKKSGAEHYPVSWVVPVAGHLVWMIDSDAASMMDS